MDYLWRLFIDYGVISQEKKGPAFRIYLSACFEKRSILVSKGLGSVLLSARSMYCGLQNVYGALDCQRWYGMYVLKKLSTGRWLPLETWGIFQDMAYSNPGAMETQGHNGTVAKNRSDIREVVAFLREAWMGVLWLNWQAMGRQKSN